MKKKKHFDPSVIYVLLFAFNFFDFVLSDYFALSSTVSMVPRLVVEGVMMLVSLVLLAVGALYVFDRDVFFRTWTMRVRYRGYALHYCAISLLGHGLLLADAVTLTIMGESFITRGTYDVLAIAISFSVMFASIGVYEPASKDLDASSAAAATPLPVHQHHANAPVTSPAMSPVNAYTTINGGRVHV